MDLMCPKHNEPLIALDKPSRTMPANAHFLCAELGLAYCEQCDDTHPYACDTNGPYLLEEK